MIIVPSCIVMQRPIYTKRKEVFRKLEICRDKQFHFFFGGNLTLFEFMALPYGSSWLHSLDTPHSVKLLWMSDQPDAETSTSKHTTLTRQQTSMTPAGFKTAIPASRRPQTHASDRAAAGISLAVSSVHKNRFFQMTAQNVRACLELTAPT